MGYDLNPLLTRHREEAVPDAGPPRTATSWSSSTTRVHEACDVRFEDGRFEPGEVVHAGGRARPVGGAAS